ncbi:hypothetical protein HYQ46_003027 [Verticillium longisporum]|nr:hypothetical protein HYQ46_003027 [Verticillium longisporum]
MHIRGCRLAITGATTTWTALQLGLSTHNGTRAIISLRAKRLTSSEQSAVGQGSSSSSCSIRSLKEMCHGTCYQP